LKSNGIYMTFSVIYQHTVQPDERASQGGSIPDALYNELPNRNNGKNAYGYASFVREYQDSQWVYFDKLMNHVNPYTGLAYKNDPALLSVEMRNEDSVFFHNPLTLIYNERNTTKQAHANRMRQMFGTWVKNRYGTEANLTAAWGTARQPVDNWNTGVFEFMGAYHFGTNGPLFEYAGQTRRAGDFIQFLNEMQKADYQNFYNRMRGIGYQGNIVTTAWKSGEPAPEAANNNTDDVGDIIDRHNYFGGGAGGWQVTTGSVKNETHMDRPGRGLLSTGFNQVEDKPFAMSEWTQSPPNQWKAEASPLIAFYGMGLQGWDASYQFSGSHSYMANGWADLNSFVSETPHYMGQFPALTHAIYNNHISQGDVVSARRVTNSQMFAGTDPLQTVRNTVNNDASEIISQGTTPVEALAVGRVTLKTGSSAASSQVNLSQYINNATQTVTSTTNQLSWNWNQKTVEIRADKTQGIVGFAGNRTFNLPGFDVTVNTPFVSLLFTAMDNLPLTQSRNILVTAMAQDRQRNSTYNADGTQLTNLGVDPLELQPVKATITAKGDTIGDVRVLDVYGVPTSTNVQRTGNAFTIDGRYASYYYQITRATDAVAPTVSTSNFDVNAQNAFTLNFSESVGSSLLSSNISLTNRTTGQVIPRSGLTITMNPDNTSATIRSTATLANGFYRLNLPAGSVTDSAGNTLASSFQIDTHILPGDATRDARVDFADLVILARNFNQSPRLFTQGDFNYSGTVDFADLVILARNFNVVIAPPSPLLSGAGTTTARGGNELLK
jgi:hypothetical protein